MNNPLDFDEPFEFEGMNPNPSFSKNKDGPVYRISFEVEQELWDNFVAANTSGMIVGASMYVSERHFKEPEKPKAKKGSKLSNQAGIMTNNEDFQTYSLIALQGVSSELEDSQVAVNYIREYCGVQSRSELDTDDRAKKMFMQLMKNFNEWMESQ